MKDKLCNRTVKFAPALVCGIVVGIITIELVATSISAIIATKSILDVIKLVKMVFFAVLLIRMSFLGNDVLKKKIYFILILLCIAINAVFTVLELRYYLSGEFAMVVERDDFTRKMAIGTSIWGLVAGGVAIVALVFYIAGKYKFSKKMSLIALIGILLIPLSYAFYFVVIFPNNYSELGLSLGFQMGINSFMVGITSGVTRLFSSYAEDLLGMVVLYLFIRKYIIQQKEDDEVLQETLPQDEELSEVAEGAEAFDEYSELKYMDVDEFSEFRKSGGAKDDEK